MFEHHTYYRWRLNKQRWGSPRNCRGHLLSWPGCPIYIYIYTNNNLAFICALLRYSFLYTDPGSIYLGVILIISAVQTFAFFLSGFLNILPYIFQVHSQLPASAIRSLCGATRHRTMEIAISWIAPLSPIPPVPDNPCLPYFISGRNFSGRAVLSSTVVNSGAVVAHFDAVLEEFSGHDNPITKRQLQWCLSQALASKHIEQKHQWQFLEETTTFGGQEALLICDNMKCAFNRTIAWANHAPLARSVMDNKAVTRLLCVFRVITFAPGTAVNYFLRSVYGDVDKWVEF